MKKQICSKISIDKKEAKLVKKKITLTQTLLSECKGSPFKEKKHIPFNVPNVLKEVGIFKWNTPDTNEDRESKISFQYSEHPHKTKFVDQSTF